MPQLLSELAGRYWEHILPALLIGFLLDALTGDPPGLPHPVRWMGGLISRLERALLREEDGDGVKSFKGAVLTAAVLLLSGAAAAALMLLAERLGPGFGLAAQSALCAFLLAARDLARAAGAVYEPLKAGEIEGARRAVSMIVGRDTERLSGEGICKAAVESVAESASDGVIAPLFFMALGGPVAGVLYKAANTMDSMLGYKNERYRRFGTASARLDDLLNYIPSRLGARIMIAAAWLLRLDAGNALRIYRRDRRKHASPNSAQTESVAAGALGIRLAGDAWYFGKLVKKPEIGDALRPAEPEDIQRATALMYVSAVIALVLFLAPRLAGRLL